jgi:NADH-quinone oxidoreductase subunit A
MSDSLLPVLLTIAVAMTVAGSLLLAGTLFGRPKRSLVDRTPYECGITPFERSDRHRFSIKYYLVAMLFILFDIEAAFLYPWAVTFRDFAASKWFVLGEMGVFLAILIAGYVYLWWRGALQWD